MNKIGVMLLNQMLIVSSMVAIIGLKGCIFFMGDAQKEENVSLEAGKRLNYYLKEQRH
ncbi:MAG: hypothetical protein K2L07_02555 [Lachnospiraceae bacterium]|nr:hypothetical protein [Lachnospiraceae bacterium]